MRRKYGNVPTMVNGQQFDSKAEAFRYLQLLGLQQAGEIEDLELQPRYRLEVNGVKIADYRADFRYVTGGLVVVEDVKGGSATKTPSYRLKAKLMWAIHGIKVKEVTL
jgi:hypothetical protein